MDSGEPGLILDIYSRQVTGLVTEVTGLIRQVIGLFTQVTGLVGQVSLFMLVYIHGIHKCSRTHARMHACTHTHTHMHTRTHTRTHTHHNLVQVSLKRLSPVVRSPVVNAHHTEPGGCPLQDVPNDARERVLHQLEQMEYRKRKQARRKKKDTVSYIQY